MSREIKFRAWDAAHGVMVYNVNINDGKPVMPGYQWFSPQNTVHGSEPMQYTGLHDKNGVEIYEGDVVYIVNFMTTAPGTEPYNAVIEWDKYRWCMRAIDKPHWHPMIGPFPLNNLDPFGLDITVIGNIYENPELLERGDANQ